MKALMVEDNVWVAKMLPRDLHFIEQPLQGGGPFYKALAEGWEVPSDLLQGIQLVRALLLNLS